MDTFMSANHLDLNLLARNIERTALAVERLSQGLLATQKTLTVQTEMLSRLLKAASQESAPNGLMARLDALTRSTETAATAITKLAPSLNQTIADALRDRR